MKHRRVEVGPRAVQRGGDGQREGDSIEATRVGRGVVLAVLGVLGACDEPEEVTLDELVARAEAVPEPDFDPARKPEPGYLEAYRAEQHERYRRRAALLLQACRRFPADAEVPRLMNRRWTLLGWNQDPRTVADEVLADVAATEDLHVGPVVKRHAAYWRSYFRAHQRSGEPQVQAEIVDAFVRDHPDDPRALGLLELVADNSAASAATRIAALERIVEGFADTHAGTFAPGRIRQLRAVGEPFELTFDDFSSGARMSTAAWRGKVVVLDFWATTCVPCVRELPALRDLYDRYHERGVEFVGISLDVAPHEGGADALRRFLEREALAWPQFYQGAGFASEFSKSWGIGSIPAMFVLDKQGRLATVDGRGRLEEWIERLSAQ